MKKIKGAAFTKAVKTGKRGEDACITLKKDERLGVEKSGASFKKFVRKVKDG